MQCDNDEADWAAESVNRAEILRLIYQGRFLHSSVTLGALALPLGRTTVMHLVPREHLPEPNSHGITTPTSLSSMVSSTTTAATTSAASDTDSSYP
ncbi:Ubiquitin-like protein 3 [Eumeta japonica]|uniref:Ubiquitin-like protein 3 n=1 Tax=Eumeta variegata TaxID=151549 RepID=A0A4C1XLN0_EUMVA|nr:Ubiquitin-like protein 3 [Eumeta japonica]